MKHSRLKQSDFGYDRNIDIASMFSQISVEADAANSFIHTMNDYYPDQITTQKLYEYISEINNYLQQIKSITG